MKKVRRIKTPFYTIKAYDILRSVYAQLCDGIWANAIGYNKYWINFNVKRCSNGQVYFEVNTCDWNHSDLYTGKNPFTDMSDTQFTTWIANKLKAIIRADILDNKLTWKNEWKRTNVKFESAYLSYEYDERVTVADVYAIYDWLYKGIYNELNMYAKVY